METLGKILLIAGIVIALSGLLFIFGQNIPFLGKLPGDIFLKKDGYSFYFPIVTCILISIVLTIVVNIVLHFFGR